MKSTVCYQSESVLQYIQWAKLCRSLQEGIDVVQQEINSSSTTPKPCRDSSFSLGHILHSWMWVCYIFSPPFDILRSVILLFSPQWERERAVLGEKGVTGECQGEIREANARKKEQIPIKQISLLSWCMSALTIMTALHVVLQCSVLNVAKEAMAHAVLWKPVILYSSDGHRPFNVS